MAPSARKPLGTGRRGLFLLDKIGSVIRKTQFRISKNMHTFDLRGPSKIREKFAYRSQVIGNRLVGLEWGSSSPLEIEWLDIMIRSKDGVNKRNPYILKRNGGYEIV